MRDKSFDVLPFDRMRGGFGLAEGPDGKVFANFGGGGTVLTQSGRRIVVGRSDDVRAFRCRSSGFPTWIPDRVVWFGSRDNLFRMDLTRVTSAANAAFPALVRRVTVNQSQTCFAGTARRSDTPAAGGDIRVVALRVRGAELHRRDRHRSTRRGSKALDDDWSPWTTEARRDFTNVGFGDYRFRVRARNVIGQISERGDLRLHDPAAVVSHVVGVCAATSCCSGWPVSASIACSVAACSAKERERAQFAEARLRAEAAEALARSESEGKKQVELLSDIGREITASLDFETIFGKLYERVNQLADADVFGVGLYHPDRQEIEYRLAIEKGKRYAPYSRTTTDRDQLPVWCIEHREPVFINDLRAEYRKYVSRYDEQSRRSKTARCRGSRSRSSTCRSSPRIACSASSPSRASRSTRTPIITSTCCGAWPRTPRIALDNAAAYRQLNEQEHEIRRLFEEAQKARADRRRGRRRQERVPLDGQPRAAHAAHLGARLRQDHQEAARGPHLPAGADRRPKIVQTIQQVDENLKVVVSEGERLTKLIDDVLDLAKIEAGQARMAHGAGRRSPT